jgi:Fur family ferric uptake transcriptional regulator
MNKDYIYKNIRECGGRITKLRKGILQILSNDDCLISQADLLLKLKKIKLSPNRSTIFRELLFLSKNNIVIKNTISGIDYYEMANDHHHHLVCLKCNLISKVEADDHLEKQEKQILKNNKFIIINHSLEFYGYCHNCQT